MNNLIKQIVESKYNFNIDIEGNDINSLSKSKYNSKSLKELIELYNDIVDLGLPSKTLWYEYNLDVDPNLLSKPEDWYGGYYAWGELEGNKIDKDGDIYFGWENYKFAIEKDSIELTKYCNNSNHGLNDFTDNLTELLPEDDVAYLNKKLHNYKFHIPTKELCEELIKYTTNYWVYNYNPNKIKHNPEDDAGIQGLNGRIFEGKNKNLLFIPTAGFCYGSNTIYGAGYSCKMWTSSLYLDGYPGDAYCLYFGLLSINVSDDPRFYGFTIRPVINL